MFQVYFKLYREWELIQPHILTKQDNGKAIFMTTLNLIQIRGHAFTQQVTYGSTESFINYLIKEKMLRIYLDSFIFLFTRYRTM